MNQHTEQVSDTAPPGDASLDNALAAAWSHMVDRCHAVARYSIDGTIRHANENLLFATGYLASELVGQHVNVLHGTGPDEVRRVREQWDLLARGETVSARITRVAKDGTPLWFETTLVPSLGADGAPESVLEITRHIAAA